MRCVQHTLHHHFVAIQDQVNIILKKDRNAGFFLKRTIRITYVSLFPKRCSIEDPFSQALTMESRLTVFFVRE